MPSDRIAEIGIKGMRCVESINLRLKDFTVLIGENGTGKSTIIEALELLRKAATESMFVDKVYQHHDGTRLVRTDKSAAVLAVNIAGNGPDLTYLISIVRDGSYLRVGNETIIESSQGKEQNIMLRVGNKLSFFSSDGEKRDEREITANSLETVITHASFLNIPHLVRVQRALASIEVHTALDLRRSWSQPQGSQTARSSNLVRPVDRVEPGGVNLVNVFAALKNQRNWKETLGRLQVALGEIEDVLLVSEASGGTQMLWIRWVNGLEIPLSGLSDGQISTLALIAIQQLKRPTPPSLVALDEPEIHLHPGLVARVAIGLQEMSEDVPIVVGTQSDAFLNAIERPEENVVLCKLDEQRRTMLLRPDREQLRDWLTEFKGLGEMRNEGLQSVVFPAGQ